MAASDDGGSRMPKVDLDKDFANLSKTQLDYMRKIEKENLVRAGALRRTRRNNILTGVLLTGGVLGIYLYSMFAVKQEKFLDFDEEAKESEK